MDGELADGRDAFRDALLRSSGFLEALVEGIVLVGADGTILDANTAALRLLGLTRHELSGRAASDPRWAAVREDGSPFPSDEHPVAVTMATGEPCTDVVMGVDVPGFGRRWISIDSRLLVVDGEVAGAGAMFVDVTDRIEQREALVASDERFRTLAENASDVVFETGADGRFRWVSPSVTDLLGWHPDQLVGTAALALICVEDRSVIESQVPLLSRGDVVRSAEFRVRRADGDLTWVSARIRPVLDSTGSVASTIVGLRDIGAEVEARRALEASEEHFHLLAEHASDVVCFSGPDRRITWASPAVTATLGWKPEELLGTSLVDLAHPDDAAWMLAAQDRRYVPLQPVPVADEFLVRMRTSTGVFRWMSGKATALTDDDGVLVGMASALRDVDALVQALDEAGIGRARLQVAIDSMLDPHMVLEALRDDEGSIVDFAWTVANEAACTFVGVPAGELLGSRLLDRVTDESGAQMLADCVAAMASDEPIELNDQPFAWTGSPRRYDIRARSVGEFLSCTWRDVTDRFDAVRSRELALRHHSAEIQAAHDKVVDAARVKDEFLASMSHELRAPLATILAVTETVLGDVQGEIGPQFRRMIEMIDANGQHLLSLINDILDLSRIEAQMFDIEPTSLSPRELCRTIELITVSRARLAGLTFHVADSSGIDTFVGDRRRITQVLVNLVDNAVKFTGPGHAVGIDIERVDDDRIAFAVWDTGPGIPAQHAGRIFEPFVQIDAGLDRFHAGTGLGLALVKRLTELHGGTVSLHSTPGEGSRFTVTLPIASLSQPEVEPLVPPLAHERSAPGPAVEVRVARRVLLVEDSPDYGELVSEYLVSRGHDVRWLDRADAIVDEATAFEPTVVLMDMQMPGMDGIEAIRRLRGDAHLAGLCIVAVTGLAMAGDRERCLQAGADDYLAKPVSLRAIAERVERSTPFDVPPQRGVG